MLEIVRNPRQLAGPAVGTIGTFDGLHLGHREIVRQVVVQAQLSGCVPTLISFYPHPAVVVAKREGRECVVLRLTRLRQFVHLLSEIGIKRLCLLHFTRSFSEWTGHEFIREVVVKRCGVSTLLVGEDAGIGKGRSMSAVALAAAMSDHGGQGVVVPSLLHNGSKISSRTIRQIIAKGDVVTAAALLGRPYGVVGRVQRGDGRGRQLGFPTANLGGVSQLVPAVGVYACWAQMAGRRYKAMVNVGFRPTFDAGGKAPLIEVHLLSYAGADFYRERMEVTFVARIRDEVKFSDADALCAQLEQDRDQVTRLL